jgi:TPR repeat protein
MQSLSDEEIAALVAGGRQLMVAGDIPNARLVLQQAAEAGNATAALELGVTYDPYGPTRPLGIEPQPDFTPDIAMARTWYQKAKDLGSTEAARRLENLARFPGVR